MASAVLIRGVVADDALEPAALPGPGRLAAALGIDLGHDGLDLLDPGSSVRLLPAAADDAAHGVRLLRGPRIGITKAVELPWRFAEAGSRACRVRARRVGRRNAPKGAARRR